MHWSAHRLSSVFFPKPVLTETPQLTHPFINDRDTKKIGILGHLIMCCVQQCPFVWKQAFGNN